MTVNDLPARGLAIDCYSEYTPAATDDKIRERFIGPNKNEDIVEAIARFTSSSNLERGIVIGTVRAGPNPQRLVVASFSHANWWERLKT